ncbi:YecA family protein [Pseudomonas sp. NPDC090233]|uniref:YecA family protein n=1 Tax=Pseudomonas sp. NPDC090233 TaxID=3364479 RepID=UPI00383AE7CB
MDQENMTDACASLLRGMESTAARMRDLIVAMPPHDLLGYIYARHMMKAIAGQRGSQDHHEEGDLDDLIDENQFLLEYVHAVLASDVAPMDVVFDEARCVELFELGRKLREQAMIFAMASSDNIKDGVFGPDTADIEFRAKSSWVLLRGNRYQVLEGEFYRYVLSPHEDVLREVYGANSAEIADGFQALANAGRSGHSNAISMLMRQFESAQNFAAVQGKPLEGVMEEWVACNEEQTNAAGQAINDMFRGGIANVSLHTKLPPLLLADLAYRRGEETEFFAPGDFVGTPYRTLPARKKPLIQLGEDYYAVDPCFTRDSGYRALLFNLLQRKPDYKKSFNDRQKTMSEAAFADILAAQLPGAKVFQEVYYKDPATNKWSENDTLILIDDVLFLVEAKAGAAATIASPALDFGRHAQSVQDLVIKAYTQCERFFNYLNSSEEVTLYQLVDGKYQECGRVRSSEYRVMIPIGLTVESFSPFSAYCKKLPQIAPLLGKHAFISMSIDDLFVLKRFLPTPGEFMHYMEVRQAVAARRHAHLFDEFDHLGAYLKKNRFDHDIDNHLADGSVSMLIWDGMSNLIDKSFEGEDWNNTPLPKQHFPVELDRLLQALDANRTPGWLVAESRIRDLGEEGRDDLAKTLSDLRRTLNQRPYRFFLLGGSAPIFVWLQQHDHKIDWTTVHVKASAGALSINASDMVGILACVDSDGTYHRAQPFAVHAPGQRTAENDHVFEEAARITQSALMVKPKPEKKFIPAAGIEKQGRNELCQCGSGVKFKKCHGR